MNAIFTTDDRSLADMRKKLADLELTEGVIDYELAGRIAYLAGEDIVWDAPGENRDGGHALDQWQRGFEAQQAGKRVA